MQGLSRGEEVPLSPAGIGGTAEALLPQTDEAAHVSHKRTTRRYIFTEWNLLIRTPMFVSSFIEVFDTLGMMSNSNHYIYNYGSVRSVSSVSGVNGDGVEVESVREGGEGEGGHGEAGEEEEEEGWDDELEAAELALFQESMSVSEMDWIGEEEKEREEEEEEDRMDPTPLASRATTGANTAQRRVPNRPPPTPRAVRTAMKAPGGDGSGRRLVAHLAQVTDSPATVPVRKHSGQSIYKAPGQQQEPPSQKG